jgi:pre-mRNA-splicing factor SYF1
MGEYLDFLLKNDQLEDALSLYVHLIAQNSQTSQKTPKALQLELAQFIAMYPTRAQHLDCEAILEDTLEKYPEEQSRVWVLIADYYTRLAQFDRAREVFDEALDTCADVASFGILYSAYLKFEQTFADSSEQGAFDRLEELLDKRPFLLSNVVLRQSPNNVKEWLQRVEMCQGDVEATLETFTEALKTIDAEKAIGKFSSVWIEFAQFYERHQELENANIVYHKATQQVFKSVEELSACYC